MNKPSRKVSIGVKRAVRAAGSYSALARSLKITAQSVIKWRRIPRKRIVAVEQATKVPREKLAPELYKR